MRAIGRDQNGQSLLTQWSAGLALVLLLLVLNCVPAWSHASLISIVPSPGDILETTPERFEVNFTEPVSATAFRVIEPDGTVNPLAPNPVGASLIADAPPDLSNGTNVFSWRVLSVDGHPIAGAVLFSIGYASAAAAVPSNDDENAVRIALWGARLALYLGLFVGAGGAFFSAWMVSSSSPSSLRSTLRLSLVLGFLAVPLALGFQGLDITGGGFVQLLDGGSWSAALNSAYARTVLVALLSLAAAFLSLATEGARSRLLAAAALLGVGLAIALSGHASTAPPRWATTFAVFLHSAAVAFWVGSLIPLAFLLRLRDPVGARALTQFSRAIPFALVALLLAGLLLVLVQLTGWTDLWTTAYGRVLSAKLLAVAGLLGLATWNRYRNTAPAERLEVKGTRSLSRSIVAEMALVLVVLGVAGLWRYTPPPRSEALALAALQPIQARLEGRLATADVTLSPGRVGRVDIRIELHDPDGRPLIPQEITLMMSNPSAAIEPIAWTAHRGDDGIWRATDVIIPLPGEWRVELEAVLVLARAFVQGTITIPD